jgi:hypothetical protein
VEFRHVPRRTGPAAWSGSPALALARKETLPQQKLFKDPAFYDQLLVDIESGRFAAHLEVQARRDVNVQPSPR